MNNKILFVTNLYPNDKNPYFGIFVKEQKESIEKYHDCKIDVYVIKGKLGYLRSLWEIPYTFKKNQYDIVHTHFGFSAFYALFSKKTALKTVITFHGSDILRNHLFKDKIFKIFLNKIVQRVAHCIVQNIVMKKVIESINSKVSVITCGVDTNIFRPYSSIKREDTALVAFASRKTNEVKNWQLFEDTLECVKKTQAVEYREIFNMKREEVAELFSRVNCLLMTSHTEGSPQVVKEALACNCPIVSVDVGDVYNQLDGVANCYVSKNRDSKELASYVNNIISNKDIRSNGLETLREKGLTQEQVVKNIYNLYQTI